MLATRHLNSSGAPIPSAMSSAFSIMNRGPRGHVAGIKTKPTRSSAQAISKLTTKRGQHRTVSLHPSQTRIRWQSSKLASLSFVTVSRVSRTAFARVRRSLRDGFGDDSVVLEVGDFALVVGIELDVSASKRRLRSRLTPETSRSRPSARARTNLMSPSRMREMSCWRFTVRTFLAVSRSVMRTSSKPLVARARASRDRSSASPSALVWWSGAVVLCCSQPATKRVFRRTGSVSRVARSPSAKTARCLPRRLRGWRVSINVAIPVFNRVPTVVYLVDVALVFPVGRRVERLFSREPELRVGVRLVLWTLGDSLDLVGIAVAVSFVFATPPVDERFEGILWLSPMNLSRGISLCVARR